MESEECTSAVTPNTSEGIMGWVESVIITTSQTSIGQGFFHIVDYFLWIVEKCAQWSLPTQEITSEENGKMFGKVELVRPLPWILFLPGLVILRVIRYGLNVGAFLFGYPQIQPSGMVKFVQKNRRWLRTMNLKAVRSSRRKLSNHKDKRLTIIEAKKALIRSIRLTLSILSCLDTSQSTPSPPPTKIRVSHTDLEPAPTPDEKSTTESVGSPIHQKMKRKFSQVSSDEGNTDESENESEDKTLQSKLERLAMDGSTDDSDFNPVESVLESSSSGSSKNNMESEVSFTELQEIQEEARNFVRDSVKKDMIMSLENVVKRSKPKKTEQIAESGKRDDSSETQLQATIRAINDFKASEASATSIEAPVPPEPTPTPAPEVTNGVMPEKHATQPPPLALMPEHAVPSEPRTSFSKENSLIPQEKKGKHKRMGRRDMK
ncbi:uncharacterized protein LOC143430634 [Xylocopa sonorina]|uniref:uncharacterized protein LOC143430634 n=1 Tax=Xylocopa sonorina TaxID=1818115 RepID=UPI00403AEB3E